jgi:hypothetical protein
MGGAAFLQDTRVVSPRQSTLHPQNGSRSRRVRRLGRSAQEAAGRGGSTQSETDRSPTKCCPCDPEDRGCNLKTRLNKINIAELRPGPFHDVAGPP